MKQTILILTSVAAILLILATISSIASVNILKIDPVYWSMGSVNLLIIASAFGGIDAATIKGPVPEMLSDSSPEERVQPTVSDRLLLFAYILAAFSLLAFIFAAITAVKGSSILGHYRFGWSLASINLALFAIVLSRYLVRGQD